MRHLALKAKLEVQPAPVWHMATGAVYGGRRSPQQTRFLPNLLKHG
jgi:hypothetical protein